MDNNYNYRQPWIMQRADPYVYHKDGFYYFTGSLPKYDGIALRRSESLIGLADAEETVVWKKHVSGPMSEHIWAPELHYLDGKWYLYFAGGERDDIWQIRPYVLECEGQDPINDPWVERGMMQAADDDEFSFHAFSLDMTIFENKGERYCIWAEKVSVGRQISNLYIARMQSPVKLETAQVLLTTPDYDWERHGFWVNEGPAVIHHEGRLFVTYSASDTGVNYCVGLLTADEDEDLLDPKSWEKERYPVLKTDESLQIYGPGHNSFVETEDGRLVMVFHARTEKDLVGDPLYVPNRHAMMLEVKWDEEGKPVFEF